MLRISATIPVTHMESPISSKWKQAQNSWRAACISFCVLLASCELAEDTNPSGRFVDDPFIVEEVVFKQPVFRVSQTGDPSGRFFDLNLRIEQEVTIDTSLTPPLVKLAMHFRRSPSSLLSKDDTLARYWLNEFRFATEFIPADSLEITRTQTQLESAKLLPYSFELFEWNREQSFKLDSEDQVTAGTFRMFVNDFRGDGSSQAKTRIIEVNAEFETTVDNRPIKIFGKFDIDYSSKL